MIPVVPIAIGVVAVGVGWLARRVLVRRAAPPPREAPREGTLAVGDVIVLEGGRGRELWLARGVDLCEGDADPFLRLFEVDGAAASRCFVLVDPSRPEEIALLHAQEADGLEEARRAPTSIDVALDGDRARLRLEARRTVRAVVAAGGAEGESALPEGEVAVGLYRGGAQGRALLLQRTGTASRLLVGRACALAGVSILASR